MLLSAFRESLLFLIRCAVEATWSRQCSKAASMIGSSTFALQSPWKLDCVPSYLNMVIDTPKAAADYIKSSKIVVALHRQEEDI